MELLNNLLRRGGGKSQPARTEQAAYTPRPDPESWLKYEPVPKHWARPDEEVTSTDVPKNLFKPLGLPEDFQEYEARNRLKAYNDGTFAVECIGIDVSGYSSHVDWLERRYLSEEEYNRAMALVQEKKKK